MKNPLQESIGQTVNLLKIIARPPIHLVNGTSHALTFHLSSVNGNWEKTRRITLEAGENLDLESREDSYVKIITQGQSLPVFQRQSNLQDYSIQYRLDRVYIIDQSI